jgi:hypothetical protein
LIHEGIDASHWSGRRIQDTGRKMQEDR